MISLSQTLLPHRLDAIRSLQLTWAFFHPAHTVYDGDKILLTGDEALWKVCWAVVGGMKGVSDIRIWLSMSPAVEAARQPEEDLLEPLKEIGLKKRIEVRVSWTLPKPEVRSWGEYPFRLIRLPEEDWGATCLQQQAGSSNILRAIILCELGGSSPINDKVYDEAIRQVVAYWTHIIQNR